MRYLASFRRPFVHLAACIPLMLAACDRPDLPTTPAVRPTPAARPALIAAGITVIGLNVLPDDINESGVVTGYINGSGDHMFRWTAADGLRDLHVESGLDWFITRGTDVSNAGHIVGHGYLTGSSQPMAIIWTPSNPVIRKLTESNAYARGVNDAGLAVGYWTDDDPFSRRAAAWLPDGTELTTSAASDAMGVNNFGQVLVLQHLGFGIWEPASDPTGSSINFISPGAFPGWTSLQGLFIDELGRVTGSGNRTGSGNVGFVWTPGPGAGTLVALPAAAGASQTIPFAINTSDQVVGRTFRSAGGSVVNRPVFWSSLNAAADYLPNPCSGESSWAAAINNSGQAVGPVFSNRLVGVLWTLGDLSPSDPVPCDPPSTDPPNTDPPPIVTENVTGTLGSNGWYTSDVTIDWTVTGAASSIGCSDLTITTDGGPTAYTCSATSTGGTTSRTATVKRDATPPTVRYSGNAGTYSLDETVAISCSADDATSGLAANSCTEISGPALTFGPGTHTYSATAIDNAGNAETASTTFTVVLTTDALKDLVQSWVTNRGIANALSRRLDQIAAASGNQRDALVRSFIAQVQAQSGRSITPEHATALIALVSSL